MRYCIYSAYKNKVQDQVLPLFVFPMSAWNFATAGSVHLYSPAHSLFAGCFDLSHLVTAGVVDFSHLVTAGVVDLSHLVIAGVVDLSHLVTAGVVDLSAGVVHL